MSKLSALYAASLCGTLVLPLGLRAQELDLPARATGALSGSEFAQVIDGLGLDARDERIVSEILEGNVPRWLRTLRPVPIERMGGEVGVKLWVAPDYLAVGSDSDYLLVPMAPGAAQRIADELEMSLPTPAMVDAIWRAASIRLDPEPIPASPEMTTVPVFLRHSAAVRLQRDGWEVGDGLVAGHKKDVVVTSELNERRGRVAIYGWHGPDGAPIQPLYLGHVDTWVDYSHGIRLVSRVIEVDGGEMDLWDALRNPDLASLLSRDGVVVEPWYPGN